MIKATLFLILPYLFCFSLAAENRVEISINPAQINPEDLETLTRVGKISISTTLGDDWSGFDKLPETEHLEIFANGERLPDELFKLITNVEAIKHLKFEEVEIPDLVFLKGFDDLETVNFHSSTIYDASSLTQIDSLRSLSFTYSVITQSQGFAFPADLPHLIVDRATYLDSIFKSAIELWLTGQLPIDGQRELVIFGNY